MQDHMSEHGVN